MAEYANNQTALETSLEGCPDPTAGRAVVVTAGTNSICHQLRDSDGVAIDLTGIDPVAVTTTEPAGTTTTAAPVQGSIALFAHALCPGSRPVQSVITIENAEEGRVCFDLPTSIKTRPGIYSVELAMFDLAGQLYVTDKFLLSVEHSLLNQLLLGGTRTGPITLGQVRTQLRDYPVLNSAWENAEFSDAEIVHSLLEPIKFFNETLPRGATYDGSNFPYHHQWLEAATANLLRISANWYLRNSRKIEYADSKTEDDKDKASNYLQLAEAKWALYKTFCTAQKITANWSYSGGSLGGTYF